MKGHPCVVCGDETTNMVNLKSGHIIPICNGEDGCLIPTGESTPDAKSHEQR